MLQALRTEAHRHLGFGGFAEYAERLFGYSPRATEEKLRVARALENLPDTDRALRDGELDLVRGAGAHASGRDRDREAWLSAARHKTVRELERLVSGRKTGDLPTDPVRPEAKRVVLRSEATAATAASFREAVAALRVERRPARRRGSAPPPRSRGSPRPWRRRSFELPDRDHDLPGLRQGFQQAAGELVAIEPQAVTAAECDAQRLGDRARRSPTRASRAKSNTPRRRLFYAPLKRSRPQILPSSPATRSRLLRRPRPPSFDSRRRAPSRAPISRRRSRGGQSGQRWRSASSRGAPRPAHHRGHGIGRASLPPCRRRGEREHRAPGRKHRATTHVGEIRLQGVGDASQRGGLDGARETTRQTARSRRHRASDLVLGVRGPFTEQYKTSEREFARRHKREKDAARRDLDRSNKHAAVARTARTEEHTARSRDDHARCSFRSALA